MSDPEAGTEPVPVARVSVDRTIFPFLIEYFDIDRLDFDDPPLHWSVVKEPGPVWVPGFAARGIRVMVRLTYRNGVVEEQWPA